MVSPDMITKTLHIDGMTCVNCEHRIERALLATPGITRVKVRYATGTAAVTFDADAINLKQIKAVVERLDYKVRKTTQAASNRTDARYVMGAAFVIVALYLIIDRLGGFDVFNAFPQAEAGMGYGMLFVIGLFTSLHCVAMCGGINLSQCVSPDRIIPLAQKRSVLRPSLLYNAGRVISYTVVGGLVGAIGSVVSFSGTAKGIVQVAAGIFMMIMGLNMLNVFPWLRRLNLRMPGFITRYIDGRQSNNSPLYVGLLNGLMPCGPLQAMQLYALSTGSPLKGALAMFLFSLGTVPLMFQLGALSSMLSKKFTSKMVAVGAVLVVILGVVMFSNGMSLSGVNLPAAPVVPGKATTQDGTVAVLQDGVQTVTTSLKRSGYEPITVQKGIPVVWTIQADQRDINGCNETMVIPEYGMETTLTGGENKIEFTPTESGTVPYSCWMGMIRSNITVVDDINAGAAGSN